jgi:hypothetical protein
MQPVKVRQAVARHELAVGEEGMRLKKLARRFTSRHANPFTLAPLNTLKRYICSANTGGNNTVDDNTIHNSKVGNTRSGATSTGVLPNRSSGKRS